MAGPVPAICAPTAGADGRDKPHQATATSEKLSADTGRFLVIPGRVPGIQADSVDWGDPRITSGDDEDENPVSIWTPILMHMTTSPAMTVTRKPMFPVTVKTL
jgi:hypothetical protein